ncbi:hypothetical protein HPB47_020928 [Ixodes persulcatus]|uniref:Uncharacterized protein n=1 Tax=Ixodes persulcatus TaxID=34615 RepID=A0AC60QE10_IXOPE|nr:hypothetical protein HPB47_020928 [Ixodes persulcatus]
MTGFWAGWFQSERPSARGSRQDGGGGGLHLGNAAAPRRRHASAREGGRVREKPDSSLSRFHVDGCRCMTRGAAEHSCGSTEIAL